MVERNFTVEAMDYIVNKAQEQAAERTANKSDGTAKEWLAEQVFKRSLTDNATAEAKEAAA